MRQNECHTYAYPRRLEGGDWSLGNEVKSCGEPSDVAAANQTLVLWESSKYCYQLSLVSVLHSYYCGWIALWSLESPSQNLRLISWEVYLPYTYLTEAIVRLSFALSRTEYLLYKDHPNLNLLLLKGPTFSNFSLPWNPVWLVGLL